jgi:hypothetical protein
MIRVRNDTPRPDFGFDGFRRLAGAIHLAALHGYAGTLDDVAFRRKMKKQTR